MKPFIHDLPAHEYHRIEAISSTEIRKLAAGKTPRHVRESRDNPTNPTPDMIMGTVVHALVTGHEEEFVVKDWDGRTVPGKARAKEVEEQFPHAEIISEADYKQAKLMAESVFRNKEAKKIIEGSVREGSFFWKDWDTQFKVRADFVNDPMNMVADLKTAKDASYPGFLKAVRYGRLDLQAHHYVHGVQTATDRFGYRFSWIVVEKEPPFLTVVYPFTIGNRVGYEWSIHAEYLARAQNSKSWAGYPEIGDEITEDHIT